MNEFCWPPSSVDRLILIYIYTTNIIVVFLASATASQNTVLLLLLMWVQSVFIVPIIKGSSEADVQPKNNEHTNLSFLGQKSCFRENASQFFFKTRNTDISYFRYYEDNSINNLILQNLEEERNGRPIIYVKKRVLVSRTKLVNYAFF